MAISYTFNPFTSNFDAITVETANGQVKVALYDPLTTSVTSGPAISSPYVIDGVTVSDGDLVLFSNLGVANNQVYQASISGGTITWTAQPLFHGAVAPTTGDLVVVTQGTGFNNQSGEFNGTTWLFNYTVRYFNGVDYFEQSSINTSTLADNTTTGTVFSVGFLGSENIFVDYSIIRGAEKEAGTIVLTTDGVTVAISNQGSALGDAGVEFTSIISGSDLVLQYTTTSTGDDATMKYNIRRWSDAAGGPGGPPSYSAGSAIVQAAGSPGNVQINSAGVLGADSNFSYDVSTDELELGSLRISTLKSAALSDNQAAPTTILTIPVSSSAIVLEYSTSRGVNFRTGRMLMATDGFTVSSADDFVEQGTSGITLSAVVVGGNIEIQYTSTSTGVSGTFKCSIRSWTA